jgi:DNA polymerase-3 subunit epsilon
MLLSRRMIQDAKNHKLETLVRHLDIQAEGTFHRALYDAEMAGKIWLAMLDRICARTELGSIPFDLTNKLCKANKTAVNSLLRSCTLSR